MRHVAGYLLATVAMPGCSSEDIADSADYEDVADFQQALGELACTGFTDCTETVESSGGPFSCTSPNASYGHSPSCPGQFVTKFILRAGDTADMHAGASWGEALPSNEIDCERSYAEAGFYKYVGGVWSLVGTQTYEHQWLANQCQYDALPGIPEAIGISGAAVAGRAYLCNDQACTSKTIKKVKTSVLADN
jgi:hypothetical protein